MNKDWPHRKTTRKYHAFDFFFHPLDNCNKLKNLILLQDFPVHKSCNGIMNLILLQNTG
jgi:hypothetical protein